jgi:hypothetical protein
MNKYICFEIDAKKLASLPVASPHRRPARKGPWLNGIFPSEKYKRVTMSSS